MILFFKIFFTEFIAEMGDKTQLMLIALTSKHKLKDIILGTAAAILVLNGLAVLAGGLVSEFIPDWLIKTAAALAFLYFAASTIAGDEDDEEEEGGKSKIKFAPLAVFCTFFLAELGDKTQLTAITFGANEGMGAAFVVWIACSLGLFAADILGMLVGYLLKSKTPDGLLNTIAFIIFSVFGVYTLYQALKLISAGVCPIPVWPVLMVVTIVFVALCGCFFVKKRNMRFVLEVKKHFHWTKEFLGEYLRKCFPIICNEVFIGVGNMMINIVLGRQTEEAIAAVAVFRTLEGLVIAFFSGFANAATVVVGKEVGAGHHETAYQRAVRLVYLCSGFIGIACLTLNLVHNPLLHMLGLSGESYRIGSGMLLIYGIAAVIRMGNWAHNDTFRSAGDAAFGSTLEITFMYLLVLPCVYLANFRFHAPFLAVFALCYVDEPIRYCIMQVHMYSGKWIKPVSEAGKRTIEEFRRNGGI